MVLALLSDEGMPYNSCNEPVPDGAGDCGMLRKSSRGSAPVAGPGTLR